MAARMRSIRSGLRPVLVAVVLVGLTVAGGAMFVLGLDGTDSNTVVVPFGDREIYEFSLAPDGQRLALSARDERGRRLLWVRSMTPADERPLPDTGDAAYPFWSSDSRFIAYFAGGTLRTIAASGGVPTVVGDAGAVSGGAWHDDVIVFARDADGGPLYRVSAAGGTAAPLTRLRDGDGSHSWPVFLPDGRRFLFTITQAGEGEPAIHVGSLDSADHQPVLSNASRVALADGYVVFIRDRALHVQPFDVEALTPRGDPIRVSDGAPSRPDGDGIRAFSLSGDGILAYQRGPAVADVASPGNMALPVTVVDWRSTSQR